MSKGQKTCEKCGTATGPRAYMCKKCNTPFIFKAKSKEAKNTKIIKNFDWRELVKGDRIRVAGGPFFVNKGDFIPMGYRGRFVVDSIDQYGIRAFGLDRHQGFCHIWMAGDMQNAETGVWKTSHKMIKLKQKEIVS